MRLCIDDSGLKIDGIVAKKIKQQKETYPDDDLGEAASAGGLLRPPSTSSTSSGSCLTSSASSFILHFVLSSFYKFHLEKRSHVCLNDV